MSWLKNFLQKKKYGPDVVIVSGLPRSGTSMMMKMLEAGGVDPMTDNLREADVDNPKGYYEYERVKNLEDDKDKSYVQEARGKSLKVISFLLKHLPPENFYRVIFMVRDLDEVIASQNKMLDHREAENPIRDEKAKELYRKHLINVKVLTRMGKNFDLLEVNYKKALQDPETIAKQINQFLGGKLDVREMATVVDPSLYRNRKEELKAS